MRSALDAVSVSKRVLLSLLGHLNFAMRVIPQGHFFVSRLLDLSKSVKKLHDMVKLYAGYTSELWFWWILLSQWNGISFFHNENLEFSFDLKLYIDVAPSVSFGFFFNNQWFPDTWLKELSSLPANITSAALMDSYPIGLGFYRVNYD